MRRSQKVPCSLCGNLKSPKAIYCRTCFRKTHGISLQGRTKFYCKDCGGEIAKRKYIRCHSCSMKERWSHPEYVESTRAAIRESFDSRWNDPVIREKIIGDLMDQKSVSKLEKRVAVIASNYGFHSSVVIGKYIVDLCNSQNKIIVEINGDLWHCNPKFWQANDIHPNKKITAQEIWNKDLSRKSELETMGYCVFVIWETEIIKGKESFIKSFFEKIDGNRQ